MIIRDTQLVTKEDIQARINSVQKQLDQEINAGCRGNHVSARDRKNAKIKKLNERMATLCSRLREQAQDQRN